MANDLRNDDAHGTKVTGVPVLVAGQSGAFPLEKINLASATHSEAWLQQLAFEHPQVLPVAGIEPGFGALCPVAMEVPCGAGYIDNLYITGSGEIVVVEAKLWRNPQARREVVAQALDYVAALAGMGFEAFEAACRKGKGMTAATLHALVVAAADALDEQGFVDAVSRNLARGRMLVIVLGDGIRGEAEALAGLLQSHAGAHFTFALVELALWQDPRSGEIIAIPGTLARTRMITRGVVTIEEGRALVSALPAAQVSRSSSISEELFFEQLAGHDPNWPDHVKSLLDLLEPLGIYPDFQAALNLKLDLPDYEKPINFGYITKAGKVWTDACCWSAGADIAAGYNRTLADLIGGSVAMFPSGNSYLSTNGKSAPLIGALLPQHAGAWAAAISTAIEELRADTRGDRPGVISPRPATRAAELQASAPTMSPHAGRADLYRTFDDAYQVGLPLIGIVEGIPRSPVMGFIRLRNGFAWCDDGIAGEYCSGNPLHPVEGEVEEFGATIRCGATELRPIDPDDRQVMSHWEAAVDYFGGVEAMHAHAQKHLCQMFGEWPGQEPGKAWEAGA